MSELKDNLLKLAGLHRMADAEDCPDDVCDEIVALSGDVVVEIEKTYGPLFRLMANAHVLRAFVVDDMPDPDNTPDSDIAFWDGFIGEVSFNVGDEHCVDFRITEVCRSTPKRPQLLTEVEGD